MSLTLFPASKNGIYTQDQLFNYLKHAHPVGLSILLAHDDFEIKEHVPGRFALRVGNTSTRTGEIKNKLWLTEVNAKTTGKFKGLHYYTLEDGSVNQQVHGSQGFKGTGVFSKFTKSGRVSGFAFITKALFQLIMLYTSHRSVYSTIGNDHMTLGHLTIALGAIAKHGAPVGEVDVAEDGEEVAAGIGEDGNLIVAEEGGEPSLEGNDNRSKEAMQAEVDEGASAKKIGAD